MTGSYRQILRSTTIIGGASAINIVLSLLRMKVAAVLLGPSGVGLIGLFSNLVGVAISVGGMGLDNSGTRQIAAATGKGDERTVFAVRTALFWCTLIMAVTGSILFWSLRGIIAQYVLNDTARTPEVAWLALAVGLHILMGSQSGTMMGLRRIGDLARVSVYSAVFSSVVGIAALWLWGSAAVVAYVIVVPLFGFLVGQWYIAKLPRAVDRDVPFPEIVAQSRAMLKLGIAIMLTTSISYSGQLLVRSLVQNELGLNALGYFQAASAISMTYIGFILSSMSQDFYPRLTAIIDDQQSVKRSVNEQIEISLLLAGPIFLSMMAIAPWVIQLLYSAEFRPAAEVLHWQIIGDIFKVASWCIGTILIASGDGRTLVKNEVLYFFCFGLFTWLFLPAFGIAGTGMSFLGMNVIAFCLVYWQCRRRIGFALQSVVLLQMAFLSVSSFALLWLARYSLTAAVVSGLIVSAAFTAYGFGRLAHKTNLGGILGRLSFKTQYWMKKLGVWHD